MKKKKADTSSTPLLKPAKIKQLNRNLKFFQCYKKYVNEEISRCDIPLQWDTR
jgi:hypothetical protein